MKTGYLSKKLTMFGFFSSFMTRISLMISSFLGCFCRLICLMATWETEMRWDDETGKKEQWIHFALLHYLLSSSNIDGSEHRSRSSAERRNYWSPSINETITCCEKLRDLPLSNLLVSCIFLFWISNTDYSSCWRTHRRHVVWISQSSEIAQRTSYTVTYGACPWSPRPSSCPFWVSVGRQPSMRPRCPETSLEEGWGRWPMVECIPEITRVITVKWDWEQNKFKWNKFSLLEIK